MMDDLDDMVVDARMEGCERMTTPHGWLQRRSAWAGTARQVCWRRGGVPRKIEQEQKESM